MEKYTGRDKTALPTEYDDLLNVKVPPTVNTIFSSPTSTTVLFDGIFTNRADMSLQFMIKNGYRCNANLPNPFDKSKVYDNSAAPSVVPDAEETLQRLGY